MWVLGLDLNVNCVNLERLERKLLYHTARIPAVGSKARGENLHLRYKLQVHQEVQ
jgi:hypothetical protein